MKVIKYVSVECLAMQKCFIILSDFVQVISRIMFSVNRSWSGRITISELRKSDFLQVIYPDIKFHLDIKFYHGIKFKVNFAAVYCVSVSL